MPGRMRVGRTLAYWSKPWQIFRRRPHSVMWSGMCGSPAEPNRIASLSRSASRPSSGIMTPCCAEVVAAPVEVLELEAERVARRRPALPALAGRRARLPCRCRRRGWWRLRRSSWLVSVCGLADGVTVGTGQPSRRAAKVNPSLTWIQQSSDRMTQRHPAGRPGLLLGAGRRRQPQRRGARTRHHDAGGQQAPGADGVAPRRVAGQPHHAAHEPDARRRAVPGARAPHPRRDRRHGAAARRVEGDAEGPAAGERHAGLRAQPRGAADLALRAQVPAGGGAAAAVGEPAAADGGRPSMSASASARRRTRA